MKLYQKMLIGGALALGLSGCSDEEWKTLEGTVKEEFGTANRIVESSGAIFGNESVKLGGPTYGLVLDVDGETYTLIIKEDDKKYDKPIYALAKAIEEGDKVWVKTYIGKDGIGLVWSDNVKLIEKNYLIEKGD